MLDIRPMTRAELDIGLAWAAAEGWNPGHHDGDTFHATDPDGFFLARLAPTGEPVGMVSAVRFGPRFGFLGFYLVDPAHRGRGHGLALWHAAMAHLGDRVVGLDGVPAQQDNYRKSGFTLAWNNVRYEGVVPGGGAVGDAVDASVVALSSVPVADVVAYDTAFFAGERRDFAARWIAQPGSVGRAVVRDGRVAGYALARPCLAGHKIGPLVADDEAVAEALFTAVVAALPAGSQVQLDVPDPNAAAVALAVRHGLAPVFETARMYTAAVPEVPMQRLFGVTTFELG